MDLFSDGTLLIVQGRCLKDGNYFERNARRYNRDGQLIDAFTLGDGINHVQIDDNDTIWLGYFDECVFGNFGWEQPMGNDGREETYLPSSNSANQLRELMLSEQ